MYVASRGRMTRKYQEVRDVLGDERPVHLPRGLQQRGIAQACQLRRSSDCEDVAIVIITETPGDLGREVLIEQHLHSMSAWTCRAAASALSAIRWFRSIQAPISSW